MSDTATPPDVGELLRSMTPEGRAKFVGGLSSDQLDKLHRRVVGGAPAATGGSPRQPAAADPLADTPIPEAPAEPERMDAESWRRTYRDPVVPFGTKTVPVSRSRTTLPPMDSAERDAYADQSARERARRAPTEPEPGTLGKIGRALASPLTGPLAARDELIRRQSPGGDLFSASNGRKAVALGLGGLGAGLQTGFNAALPGVSAAFNVGTSVGPGERLMEKGVHEPAQALGWAMGPPDSKTANASKGEYAKIGVDEEVASVASLTFMLAAAKAAGMTLEAFKATKAGRSIGRQWARPQYGAPIGPEAATRTPGGIPLDAEGREADLRPTRIVGQASGAAGAARAPARPIAGYEEMTDAEKAVAAAKGRGDVPRGANAYVDDFGRVRVRDGGPSPLGARPAPAPLESDSGLPMEDRVAAERAIRESRPSPRSELGRNASVQGEYEPPGGGGGLGRPGDGDVQYMRSGLSPEDLARGVGDIASRIGRGLDRLGIRGGPLDPGGIGSPADAGPRATGGGAPPPSGAKAIARAAFNEKIGNLRQYGDDLFHAAKDVVGIRDRSTAGDARDLKAAWERVPAPERVAMTRAIMEGRAQGTPAQQAFKEWWNGSEGKAKALRLEFTKDGIRVRDKSAPGGFRPIGEVPDFFPQRPLPEVLEQLKSDPDMRARYFGEASRQGLSEAEAGERLQSYHEPGLRRGFAGIEQAREFHWPDEWVSPDVHETLTDYLRNARAAHSEQRVLRYRDPETGAPRNVSPEGEIQGDLGDMLAKLPWEQRPAAKRLMLDVLGRDPESMDPGRRAAVGFANKVGAVNALRLYGVRPTTALIQLTQNAMTHALVGESATAKAVAKVARDVHGSYDRALRAGAVDEMSRYSETIGMRERLGSGEPPTRLQRATNVATAPMAATDMVSRLVAFETRGDFAAKTQAQLKGNAWQRGVARVNLESLDYSPRQIEAFERGLTPEEMDVLGQRIVERTQGKVTNATRVQAADGPLGRLFMQGKNFGVAQTRNAWRVAGRQLVHAGNPVPAARLLVSTYLIGKGVVAVKDALSGPSPNRPDDWMSALHEGGLAGTFGDLLFAAKDGPARLNETLDRLSATQFEALLKDFATLGAHEWSPPQGKSRGDVVLDFLAHAVPAGKEWATIENTVLGDGSTVREARAKIARGRYAPR